jgi:hypothetical protein
MHRTNHRRLKPRKTRTRKNKLSLYSFHVKKKRKQTKKGGEEKNITMEIEIFKCKKYFDNKKHGFSRDCYTENQNTNENVVKKGGVGAAHIIHAHHNIRNSSRNTNTDGVKQYEIREFNYNSITFTIPNDKQSVFLENLYFKCPLYIYKNETLINTLEVYIQNRSLKINETDFKKNEIEMKFDLEGMGIDPNYYLKKLLIRNLFVDDKLSYEFVNIKCNTDKYSEKNGYSFKLMIDINEKHQYNIKDRDDMYYFNNNNNNNANFINFIDMNKKSSIIPNLGIKDTIVDFTSNNPYFFTADKSQKIKNLTRNFLFNHFTENNDNISFNVTDLSIVNEPIPPME